MPDKYAYLANRRFTVEVRSGSAGFAEQGAP
jgi:hypothetical protein